MTDDFYQFDASRSQVVEGAADAAMSSSWVIASKVPNLQSGSDSRSRWISPRWRDQKWMADARHRPQRKTFSTLTMNGRE